SLHLVSCMASTSTSERSNQDTTRSRRARIELTFQVAKRMEPVYYPSRGGEWCAGEHGGTPPETRCPRVRFGAARRVPRPAREGVRPVGVLPPPAVVQSVSTTTRCRNEWCACSPSFAQRPR